MREIQPLPNTDFLADAALTAEQRAAWQQFRTAHHKLQQRVAELQAKQQDEADQQGMVLSRPDFNREVARLLALEERYGGTSSIVYFTCDNLELLAAQHGRNVANAAIRTLCDTLLQQVRACDIVGRLGGNEFGVLLVRCGNIDAWRKGGALAIALQTAVQTVHQHAFALDVQYGAYSFAARDDVATGLHNAAHAMLKRP
jgi:diguanylate cyclase (GGDEF)-like protein